MESAEKQIDIISNANFMLINSCIGCVLFRYDEQGYKISLPLEVSSSELGEHVLLALKASKLVPLSSYDEYLNAKALDAAAREQINWWKDMYKLRTYKALSLSSVYCLIEQKDGFLNILSYQRKNNENLGDESPEHWTKISINSTPEEIGRAVKLALTKCCGQGTEEIHKRFAELGWE